MKRKKLVPIIAGCLGCFTAIGAVCNLIMNKGITVQKQTIPIAGLPSSFEGFTILQISDLHSATFGQGQERLLNTIRQLEYDIVVLTGDMYKTAENTQPLYNLLNGLDRRKEIYWIDGNDAPYAVDKGFKEESLLTEEGKRLAQIGCNILLFPVSIEREDQRIWLVPQMDKATIEFSGTTVYANKAEHPYASGYFPICKNGIQSYIKMAR